MCVHLFYAVMAVLTFTQVKAIRAEHGKKAFGPVVVDQLYGCVLSHYQRV